VPVLKLIQRALWFRGRGLPPRDSRGPTEKDKGPETNRDY
jgi:hypothetical protein